MNNLASLTLTIFMISMVFKEFCCQGFQKGGESGETKETSAITIPHITRPTLTPTPMMMMMMTETEALDHVMIGDIPGELVEKVQRYCDEKRATLGSDTTWENCVKTYMAESENMSTAMNMIMTAAGD